MATLTYCLIEDSDKSLIDTLFKDSERMAQFWTLPYSSDFIASFLNDFIYCSKLYKYKKEIPLLPYLLAWVIRNRNGEEIGIVGIDTFNQGYVNTIKDGNRNKFIKKFTISPYYEIFIALKKEQERKGYARTALSDITQTILERTNIKGILFIVYKEHIRSINAAKKAHFHYSGPVVFKLSENAEEFERLIFLKEKE